MPSSVLTRPAPGEYAPYYRAYVDKVPEGEILSILTQQLEGTLALMQGLREEEALHRYAPGKWTVKEVLGHVIDAERVFAYRALCFSRGETAPLPGFDQEVYAAGSQAGSRPMLSLAEEFRHLRLSNIVLFGSFDREMVARKGIASGFEVSVRAIPYIVAGHERHHVDILRACYLKG